MKSYTFSEARQNFAAILEQARRDGAVRIQRRDGQSFVLIPEQQNTSPLDIAGLPLPSPSAATIFWQVFEKGGEATSELRCQLRRRHGNQNSLGEHLPDQSPLAGQLVSGAPAPVAALYRADRHRQDRADRR